MYDVIIIGTGVCGAAVARELSKYKLNTLCLEKENDIANGTTKANSGIVHAGYDPEPDTLMAKLNVLGNEIIEKLVKDLDVHYSKCGSLVLAFEEEELITLQELLERGIKNGVKGLEILSAEQVSKLEKNLSPEIKGALYAPSAGIISPWELAIAQMEIAVINGVEVKLNQEVVSIEKCDDGFKITAKHNGEEHTFYSKAVVNAAGVKADDIHAMLEEIDYKTVPNKGQYFMLDKSQGELVERVIFQCPSKIGKGILVSPTVHGNLIVGPDSLDVLEKNDFATNSSQLDFIKSMAKKSCPNIDYSETIRNFAGLRTGGKLEDFVITSSKTSDRFINLANIKSPGLSASPAIALSVLDILKESGIEFLQKENYQSKRKVVRFKELSAEEKNEIIKKDKRYGQIICRCETVSEGEIVAAIHSPIPATTIDGVKRRCNAGMGRCQGGFCSPRILEIIHRELEIPIDKICQDKEGSYILTGETEKGGDNHAV